MKKERPIPATMYTITHEPFPIPILKHLKTISPRKSSSNTRTYSIHSTHTIISKPNAKTATHSLTLTHSQMAAPPVPLWARYLKFQLFTAVGDPDDSQWRSQFTFRLFPTHFHFTLFGHWARGWGIKAGELKVVAPYYFFWRNVDVLDPWLMRITWVEEEEEGGA